MKDYDRALHYFQMAINIPGSPREIERLIAGIFERKGELQASLDFWLHIYNSSEEEWVKAIAYNHIFDLRMELDLKTIKAALEEYRIRRGRYPDSLDTLVRVGLLKEVPTDPEGKRYLYNSITGEIRSVSPYKLRH